MTGLVRFRILAIPLQYCTARMQGRPPCRDAVQASDQHLSGCADAILGAGPLLLSLLPFPPTAARVFSFLAARAHVLLLADSQNAQRCFLLASTASSKLDVLLVDQLCSPVLCLPLSPRRPHKRCHRSPLRLRSASWSCTSAMSTRASPTPDPLCPSVTGCVFPPCPQSCACQRSQHLLPRLAARSDRSGQRQGV